MSTVEGANIAIISPGLVMPISDNANILPQFGQEDIDFETNTQYGGMVYHGLQLQLFLPKHWQGALLRHRGTSALALAVCCCRSRQWAAT